MRALPPFCEFDVCHFPGSTERADVPDQDAEPLWSSEVGREVLHRCGPPAGNQAGGYQHLTEKEEQKSIADFEEKQNTLLITNGYANIDSA